MFATKTLLAVPAALVALCSAGTANAQSYRHIDRLALQLERQAREVHDEVHAHFRPTPAYRHLDRDVAEMERLARHVHEIAHRGGSVRHLRADVERLDRLFHHVEQVVRGMAAFRAIDRVALAHLRRDLDRMEVTLHHLRDDLRDLGRPHAHFLYHR